MSSLSFSWPNCAIWGILIHWPGMKARAPAAEAQSRNHWTAKRDPAFSFYLLHFHLISSRSTDILLCSQQHPQPLLDSEQLQDKYLPCGWVNERIFSSLIFMLYILEVFFSLNVQFLNCILMPVIIFLIHKTLFTFFQWSFLKEACSFINLGITSAPFEDANRKFVNTLFYSLNFRVSVSIYLCY